MQNFRTRKRIHFEQEADRKKTIAIKRRRLFKKKNRSCKNSSISNKEGVSYKSGSGYLNTADLIDESIIAGRYRFHAVFNYTFFILI